MIDRLKYIVAFLVTAQIVIVSGSLEINSEEDFYRFYENWAKSENVEAFREKQRQYMVQLMNSSVDPCDDFYEFACGNFGSIVPENKPWNHTSGVMLLHCSQNYLHQKLLEEEVDPLEEEVFQKVKTLYQSCVDNSTRKLEDLTDFVKNFGAWPILQEGESTGEFDWLNVTAHAAQYGVFPMFRMRYGEYDRRESIRFLNTNDDEFDLETFKQRAANLSLDLAGQDASLKEVENFVKKISNLQKEYGLLGWSEEIQLREIAKKTPEIDFRRYLQIYRGVRSVSLNQTVGLVEPIYFEDLSEIIAQTDSKVIANYVFVRFVEQAVEIKEKLTTDEISKACKNIVKDTMNTALIGLYSRVYFDEETHAQAKAMVDELQEQEREVINESEWITPESKVRALEKIGGVKKNVGLPDHYHNTSFLTAQYKNLIIDRNNFFKSYFNALKTKSLLAGRSEEILSKEFFTDPLIVNAFYASFDKGTLEIPAAVLQPPMFHKYSAKYVNYGEAGAVVGHEFMHGFDNRGILYDEKGDRGIWWDPRISSTYYTLADCYYKQYGQYRVDSINKTVDGGSTLAENVSDNEGLKISLKAYKKWLEDNEETSNIEYNGELLTPVQSFYLAFAQLYCSAFTQEELEEQIRIDNHSPEFIRVMATLFNSPDFAEAYKCPVGSKMNPEQKCKYLRK